MATQNEVTQMEVLTIPTQVQATVLDATEDAWQVSLGGEKVLASQALGCLVTPEIGDVVACLVLQERVWITTVLHRQTEGDLQLQAAQNRGLHVRIGQLKVSADHAQVVVQSSHVIAKTIKAVGGLWSTVMERVNHYSSHYVQHTEGYSKVQAKQLQIEAEQLLNLNAQSCFIQGESLVKARAAQIHIG
jgi:hypothetical protein